MERCEGDDSKEITDIKNSRTKNFSLVRLFLLIIHSIQMTDLYVCFPARTEAAG